MHSLEEAKAKIDFAVSNRELLLVLGKCRVEYEGRAASRLPAGIRLLMLKGDGSLAVHRNKLLRPTNYMMNARVSTSLSAGFLEVKGQKLKPRESISTKFEEIEFVKSFPVEQDSGSDLHLTGSERELSNCLMQDLSFIEAGLKPCQQESPLRTGLIDILAEDAKGKLVVIELKRRKADYDAVSQLQRYMKQVQKIRGRETRGILVAPEITKHAKEFLERSGLEFHKLQFAVGGGKARISGMQKKQSVLNDYF